MISSLKIATYCSAAAGKARRILRIIKQRVENRREHIYSTAYIGGIPVCQEPSVVFIAPLKGVQAEVSGARAAPQAVSSSFQPGPYGRVIGKRLPDCLRIARALLLSSHVRCLQPGAQQQAASV